MGHSSGDMRGRYDKTAEDREFRRKQVERIGTGLDLKNIFEAGNPVLGNPARQSKVLASVSI
jgi:hypothetical protein